MANKMSASKKKKNNLPLILTAVGLVCAALIAVIVRKVGGSPNTADEQVIASGEYLSISLADINSQASFFPVEVDGVEMEVIAVRASDGTVRTAFNTCQSCYSSGRGYYKQEGSELVCQNCGNRYTADQVGLRAGGCNPYPIFAGDQTVTEDSIRISYDFLKESSSIFANWKS